MKRSLFPLLLLLPTLLYIILFWFIPIGGIALLSFTEGDTFLAGEAKVIGLQNYRVIFENYLDTLRNTLLLPFTAAVIDLALGYPLAYFLVRRKLPLRSMIRASLIFPYFGDIYVSYGLWNLFLPGGLLDPIYAALGTTYRAILYTPFTVVLGFSIFTLPFMVLYIASSLSQIDPSLEDIAASLGARPLTTFFRIVVPLSAPGAVAGFIACFGWNLGGFLIPLLLGDSGSSNMITVRMVTLALSMHNYGLAAALAVILTIMTVTLTYTTLKITKMLV